MTRRPFQRPSATRRYRKLFIIAVEGSKTEPQYFSIFDNQKYCIKMECIASRKSSPAQVLKKMKARLLESGLKKSDEAWLVVDKDQWDEKQLEELLSWSGPRKFTEEMIEKAIERARHKHSLTEESWPLTFGSTVYRLVHNIMQS